MKKTVPLSPSSTSAAGLDLVAAVMATADTFLRESQRLFRTNGLTGAQYNVLNILAAEPTGISQRELGDRLVVDRSNVTGLIDRLEKSGWVRREDDPVDRRVYRVGLTPSGLALWQKTNPLYLEVVAQVTRGLGVKQLRDCRSTLEHLRVGATSWRLPGLPQGPDYSPQRNSRIDP